MFPSSNSMNLAIGVPPWLWKLNGMLQNQRNPHPTVGVVGITAGPREHMQYNSTTQYNAISYYIILYYIILYIYIVVIIIITIVIIYNYIYNYKYMFFHIIICIYNFVY